MKMSVVVDSDNEERQGDDPSPESSINNDWRSGGMLRLLIGLGLLAAVAVGALIWAGAKTQDIALIVNNEDFQTATSTPTETSITFTPTGNPAETQTTKAPTVSPTRLSAVLQGNFPTNQVSGMYTVYLRSFGNGTQEYEFGLENFSVPSCESGEIYVLFSEINEESNSTDISLDITAEPTQRLKLPAEYTLQHEEVSIMCDDVDFGVGNSTTLTLAPTTAMPTTMPTRLPTRAPTKMPITMSNLVVKTGTFAGRSGHVSTGRCSIVRRSNTVNGNAVISYTLHFEDIQIDPGPDVFLYLTRDASPTDVDSSSLRLELDGSDSGFFSKTGTFTQDLPEDFNPNLYNGATPWCRQFGVPFGALSFV